MAFPQPSEIVLDAWPGERIIDQNRLALLGETIGQSAADEAGATGDQHWRILPRDANATVQARQRADGWNAVVQQAAEKLPSPIRVLQAKMIVSDVKVQAFLHRERGRQIAQAIPVQPFCRC